ncbi:ABC transporter ATP-binding protein [Falsigemmobacter intermedius]|uniref:ABC transporter ATP-binding protein n=1 Tax=Falsigemmobacter intermedius TaxID=1553448 RepID=A0A3S3YBW6_9RHOB|nr:ABC transporter ATP-binding protein [Falsigemmobacter intermedius]RWY37667.1 ABC transporter ATP-binding protein [Falsigemmobacter intermedius]
MSPTLALHPSEPKPRLRDPARALLSVEDLVVRFATRHGVVHAVDHISLDLQPSETLAIVGESGSGKSTMAKAVMGLLPNARGTIRFQNKNILETGGEDLRRLRPHLQMIFQDPIASLNPRRRIEELIAQGLRIWPELLQGDERSEVDRLLREVGMNPDVVRGRRVSEFSGGQCQRIAIARVLAMRPQLVVCDEPVSALDVSVQAQILNLLRRMKAQYGLTMLFISHDLGVVRNITDRIAVMYLGRICEIGSADQVFSRPAHPYTRLLLDSVPKMAPRGPVATVQASEQPSPFAPPSGCRFRGRCPHAQAICAEKAPPLLQIGADQQAACHFPLTRS